MNYIFHNINAHEIKNCPYTYRKIFIIGILYYTYMELPTDMRCYIKLLLSSENCPETWKYIVDTIYVMNRIDRIEY